MTRCDDARTGKGAGIVRLCPPDFERQAYIDGETNGSQQETQAQQEAQAGGQESGQQQAPQGQSQVGGDAPDCEKQIAERDEKIASLEAKKEG